MKFDNVEISKIYVDVLSERGTHLGHIRMRV